MSTPATFKSFGNPLQATSPFPHSGRDRIACLQRKNQQYTLHGTSSAARENHRRKPHVNTIGIDCLVRSTKRASLGPAIVVAQQHDGDTLSCRPPHRQGRPSGGLVTSHGTTETQRHNMCRVLTAVTRLASAAQHRPRREDDGIQQENDEFPRRKPAHVTERRMEAVPDEPEEQHVDVLQVISHPSWR